MELPSQNKITTHIKKCKVMNCNNDIIHAIIDAGQNKHVPNCPKILRLERDVILCTTY